MAGRRQAANTDIHSDGDSTNCSGSYAPAGKMKMPGDLLVWRPVVPTPSDRQDELRERNLSLLFSKCERGRRALARSNFRPDQANTDEDQGQSEAADDPFAADSVRQVRADLRAQQNSRGENCRTPNSVLEDPARNMHQSSCQRHDGENEMGSGRGNVHRKIKQAAQCRNVNETTADAEQTRSETDEDAEHDTDGSIVFIMVAHAVGIDEVAYRPIRRFPRCGLFRSPGGQTAVLVFGRKPEKNSCGNHQNGENQVKRVAWDVCRRYCAQNRSGNCRDGEDHAGLIIDPFHAAV